MTNLEVNDLIGKLRQQMASEAQHQLDLERMIQESRQRVDELVFHEKQLLAATENYNAVRSQSA